MFPKPRDLSLGKVILHIDHAEGMEELSGQEQHAESSTVLTAQVYFHMPSMG
jgi:hypothetical protein